MANPIPPLLCSTPPPIDFDNDESQEDDDFGDFSTAETNFEQQEAVTESLPSTPHHKSPLGLLENTSNSVRCDTPITINITTPDETKQSDWIDYNKDSLKQETDCHGDLSDFKQIESNSDFSIEEAKDKEDFNNSDIHSPSSLELSPNISLSEGDNEDFQNKYDDTTSLPSLKFESTVITPQSDSSNALDHIEVQESTIDNSTKKVNDELSAFQSIKVNSADLEETTDQNTNAEIETKLMEQSNFNENVQKVIAYTNESTNVDLMFEADFSQFASFEPSSQTDSDVEHFTEKQSSSLNELVDEDLEDFDNFQDYLTSAKKNSFVSVTALKENKSVNSDDIDDDDFGEFNDFTQTTFSIPPKNNQFQLETLNERLKPLLNLMFPLEKDNAAGQQFELLDLEHNTIGAGLKQIDSTEALGYQWVKSNVRHSLITSLGIDSINILYGEKWNSSMPRYAANLSFNPLEPIKPIISNGLSGNYRSDVGSKTDVPAVEFDWNSSGLVNPLDGVKEITHGRKNKTINKTEHREPIEFTIEQLQIKSFDKRQHQQEANNDTQFESTNDRSTTSACSTNNKVTPTTEMSLTEIQVGLTSKIETPSIPEPTTVSELNLTANNPTSNGTFNKGHIVTPSMGIEPRNTTKDLESKCSIDFDYEMAAAGIIIDEKVVKKEYRDIEYNPSSTSGFDLNCEMPLEEYSKITGNAADCGFVCDENTKKNTCANEFLPCAEIDTNDTISLSDQSPYLHIADKNLQNNKVIKGSGIIDEEEFSDFQSVPPPVFNESVATTIIDRKSSPHHTHINKELQNDSKNTSRTGTPVALNDEMILSPAVLLPQAIKINQSCNINSPNIEWPEPGINPEELARFDEMFPQPKHVIKPSPSQLSATNISQISSLSISKKIADKESLTILSEEDDWSDFVSASVPAVNQNFSYNVNRSNQYLKNPSPGSQGKTVGRHSSPIATQKPLNSELNDDEWSDFVSSTPNPSQQYNFTSSPQFNSAAWQNANFYNNPLSVYASPTTSYYYQQQSLMTNNQTLLKNAVPNLSNSINNNNYNNNNIIVNEQYANNQRTSTSQSSFVPPTLATPTSSSIHIMQDFSTSQCLQEQNQRTHQRQQQSYSSQNQRNNISSNKSHFINNKVVPKISLIPDHGFVAPQHHYHYTHNIINVPKSNIQPKK